MHNEVFVYYGKYEAECEKKVICNLLEQNRDWGILQDYQVYKILIEIQYY